jgi:UPF0755 protein
MIIPQKIPLKLVKKIFLYVAGVIAIIVFFVCFEFYIPMNPASHESVTFTIQKGWSNDQIAKSLKELKLIRSKLFFKLYAILSFKHVQMQAGDYSLSPKMSLHQIANNLSSGNVIKNLVVIPEGWNIKIISKYLEEKGFCKKGEFILLANKDYTKDFDFLSDKPEKLSLEGYLFPDTYEISRDTTCQDIVILMLENFGRKFDSNLRSGILNNSDSAKRSIFDIVTMASIIEKEGRSFSDKKIISDIFWRRIKIDMPLQSCATVNYITGKNDPGILLTDMQIDSLYNTYKYKGLPLGPISSPGVDSLLAAIYPTPTKYLYFLSNGKTIFSETLEQHNIAKAKYLK